MLERGYTFRVDQASTPIFGKGKLKARQVVLDSHIDKELTLRDLLTIFQRRRRIVYGTILVFGALAALYCAFCTRRYEAIGTVQLQKENADAMGLESLMSGDSGGASDALTGNIDLDTQANILQSDTLALQTIESLHLEDTEDFRKRWSPVGWMIGLFSPAGVSDPPNARLEESPQRRMHLLKVFSKNLKVKPINGTRLIEIDYTNPDPRLAAAVVNALTKALSDYTFQTRYDATNQTSKWLNDQLGDLRKNSEDLQAKVVNLQRESGVYSLGAMDAQGHEQAYSAVLDKLQQATAAMTVAEQNRFLKSAIAKAAENGDAELLSGLAGNGLVGNSQSMSNSLTLLQNLRQQEATQQAALKEAEAKFGPSYPKLAELRGNIAGLDHSIRQEVDRIRERAKTDYSVAVQNEASVRGQYDGAKKQADVLNSKAIDYVIAREEAEQSRGLYEDLLKRLNEAGVLASLRESNITIVDPGRVPAKPKKPNVPLYMAIALAAGCFLGGCGALLVDSLDNKVNTISDLEEVFGETVLGALPFIEQKNRRAIPAKTALITIQEPQSTYVEALRAIRTSVLLSHGGAPPKVLLITSSIAGEGKSTASINLAVLLAQSGRKTLIVDTDLRRGTLRKRLGLRAGSGLSDLLAGQTEAPAIQSIPALENLDILLAGPTSPNPTELLGAETMRNWLQRWREQYDFVVLDSAPVLPVTDSVTLNPLTDATLLVSRAGMTERPQVDRGYRLLRGDGKHYVGLVLNGLSANDRSYYGYYGYHKYAYHYGEDHAES